MTTTAFPDDSPFDQPDLSPISALLQDPSVTSITATAGRGVSYDRGDETHEQDAGFLDEESLTAAARALFAIADEDAPSSLVAGTSFPHQGATIHFYWVDAQLTTTGASTLNIIRNQHVADLTSLTQLGAIDAELATALATSVRGGASVLVVGPTGIGKTTLLGALMRSTTDGTRVIAVEDLPELPRTSYTNMMVASDQANAADLLRMSARMRADLIVLGELGGSEALDALTRTGTTVMTSFSSTGPTRALDRLGGLQLDRGQPHPAFTFDLLVSMDRVKGRRVVTALHEVTRTGGEPGLRAWFELDGEAYRVSAPSRTLRRRLGLDEGTAPEVTSTLSLEIDGRVHQRVAVTRPGPGRLVTSVDAASLTLPDDPAGRDAAFAELRERLVSTLRWHEGERDRSAARLRSFRALLDGA